ncbi:MAG: hypothetical protein U0Q55_07050 [Vicinamibacterales bacterium]
MGTFRRAPHVAVATAVACLCLGLSRGHAQGLPSEPLVFASGRAVVSGDAALTASCAHPIGGPGCTTDTGFFNYSDYDDSILRMVRIGLSTSVRLSGRLAALGEVRMQNAHAPRPYGAYLRYRPFARHDVDIQAGRIPSTFGAFARHAYSTDNLVIGYPLAYQYLISLRYDALPATPDDLIRMRGRGWLSNFPIGETAPEAGLPLADAFRWDTGVQAHVGTQWIEAAASVTNGSLTRPLVRDDNRGKQVAARVVLKPVVGLTVGVSASRAPFITTATATAAGLDPNRFVQRVMGADVEFSRDHYLLRAETVASTFDVPTIAPRLHALATMVEGRYRLTPRLHVAARADHLGFNRITGATRTATWEAPVARWELGTGYAVQRNLQVRAAFQHNWRDGGRVRRMTALATQLLYWF